MNYKVTNGSGKAICKTWNENLLSDSDLAKWKEYQAGQYEDKSPEQISKLKRIPEATKLQRWATAKGLGKIDPRKEDEVLERETEFVFVLEEGENILNERQYGELKDLLEAWTNIDVVPIIKETEGKESKESKEEPKKETKKGSTTKGSKKKYISDLE